MSRILFPSPRDQLSTSTSSTSSTSSQHPQKLRSSSRPSLGRHDSIVSLPSPCSSPDRARESELPFSLPLGPASPTTRDGSSDVEMEDTNPFLSRPVARPGRPDHPQSSPTQGVRRKVDKERIKVVKKADWVGAKGMGRGWDSPSNPFIAREGEERVRPRGGAKKPEKVTYVFRGKRITYDLPLAALLAPEDPSDAPFPTTTPRLLFPPAAPVTPPASSNPSSAFLDALREGSRKGDEVEHGLPTPVQEKGKKVERGEGRYGPYKRVAEKDPERGMR